MKVATCVSPSTLATLLSLTCSCVAPPTTTPDFSTTQPAWSSPTSQDTDAGEESGGGGQTTGVNSGGATAQTSTPDSGAWHAQAGQSGGTQDAGSWGKEAAATMAWPPAPASDASGTMPTMPAGDGSSSSNLYPPTTVTAQDFCNQYQMYCGFGASQRDADMNACITRYNSNPGQDGCYVYHLNAAISGTATLCTMPPTQMCFDIHCPHATGLGGYCS